VSIDHSKPYPFYLAYALEENPETLGEPHEWQAEWKWDGIRGELIKRNNQFYVWSRGEELMTEKFPEYAMLQHKLPDGVALDGEIISMSHAKAAGNEFQILPFALLQRRSCFESRSWDGIFAGRGTWLWIDIIRTRPSNPFAVRVKSFGRELRWCSFRKVQPAWTEASGPLRVEALFWPNSLTRMWSP